MNLEQLFKMQDKLDKRILERFPNLKNEDLLPMKILSLQVELGELAQNWRGFKFWSANREPSERVYSTTSDRKNFDYYQCFQCRKSLPSDVEKEYQGELYADCPDCEIEMHAMKQRNPLLEEYVDCLHFILSIGNNIHVKNINPKKLISFSANITGQFNALFHLISHCDTVTLLIDDTPYRVIFNNFLHLGEMLGFTWEQIEEAYYTKNQINHERQASGY